MNERTEALAKQAAEYAIEFAVKDQEVYIPKLMEKFAELIVRECIGLLPEDCPSKNGCHTSWVMKQHFGVE